MLAWKCFMVFCSLFLSLILWPFLGRFIAQFNWTHLKSSIYTHQTDFFFGHTHKNNFILKFLISKWRKCTCIQEKGCVEQMHSKKKRHNEHTFFWLVRKVSNGKFKPSNCANAWRFLRSRSLFFGGLHNFSGGYLNYFSRFLFAHFSLATVPLGFYLFSYFFFRSVSRKIAHFFPKKKKIHVPFSSSSSFILTIANVHSFGSKIVCQSHGKRLLFFCLFLSFFMCVFEFDKWILKINLTLNNNKRALLKQYIHRTTNRNRNRLNGFS